MKKPWTKTATEQMIKRTFPRDLLFRCFSCHDRVHESVSSICPDCDMVLCPACEDKDCNCPVIQTEKEEAFQIIQRLNITTVEETSALINELSKEGVSK